MASSNTPKRDKKTSNTEISKTEGKTKKDKSIEKQEAKKNNNKKRKLSNVNSKKRDEGLKMAFPMNHIRTIIKCEDPDLRVSKEALMAINTAAEKFIEQFVHDAYACCAQDPKKCLSYDHLDFVPERVKAEDALREAQQAKEDVRKSKAT